MNCFPCFRSKKECNSDSNNWPVAEPKEFTPPPPPVVSNDHEQDTSLVCEESKSSATKKFTFRELAMATKNFRQECLLGEGGFGRIFKGTLKESGQIVAIRQLDRNGVQGGKDFVIEVARLNLLEHRNLVKLVGYCADGDQRLLVYEYVPWGSLKNHLFDLPAGKKPLDWPTRMKIALGIAEGLAYLHEKVDPPIIYRDLKSSNILLDEDNNPRLSEYGLANLVLTGNKLNASPRVMASNGYCAPEYERYGKLTLKSDVYSFGVVLLELISGRRALDTKRPAEEQTLVSWAQPIFRDQTKFSELADPLLRNGFSITCLNQAVGVAAMCVQDEPSARPLISDISAALSFLAVAPPEAAIPDHLVPILSSRVNTIRQYGADDSSREASISGCNQEGVSDSEDEGQEINPDADHQGNNLNLDYEYADCSDRSDESKRLGSSAERKSKKEPLSSGSHSISRKSRSSSISSRDSSVGFSLRCQSTHPDRSDSSNSRQDIMEQSSDYDDSSSSDTEPLSVSPSSGSPKRQRSSK